MKVSLILGTRPEIIKMTPVIRELLRHEIDFFVLHTGQHYSYNLDKVFFEQFKLPEPKYNLRVGSGTHAEETGRMLIGIERVLVDEEPDIVLVEGDTNSVLAGALAAVKLGVHVGHVEAGLRSYDREMPEEINRVVTDHISDYLFAPTEKAKLNLLREGIDENKIYVTGNTIVDAVYQNLSLADRSTIFSRLGLDEDDYFLLTLHRQENVDKAERLRSIFKGLEAVMREFEIPIMYPAHPRTRRRLKEFNINVPRGVKLIEPVDYLSFLKLEYNANLILTDSGGVQEEACVLRVPCVTLRDNTERPETVEVGANIIAGVEPENILRSVRIMLNRERNWKNPFGDGKAGARIVNILINDLG